MCSRRHGEIAAAVLKRVGMAKITAVNIQLGMTWEDVEIQECRGAWQWRGRIMHLPGGRGVYVVMHVLLNHYGTVRTMDVAVMTMRIDRIAR